MSVPHSSTIEIGSIGSGFIPERLVRLHCVVTRKTKSSLEHLVAFAVDPKLPISTQEEFDEAKLSRKFKGKFWHIDVPQQFLHIDDAKVSWPIPASQSYDCNVFGKNILDERTLYSVSQAVRFSRISMCSFEHGFAVFAATKKIGLHFDKGLIYDVRNGEVNRYGSPPSQLVTESIGVINRGSVVNFLSSREPNPLHSDLEFSEYEFSSKKEYSPIRTDFKYSIPVNSKLSDKLLLTTGDVSLAFSKDLSESVVFSKDGESLVHKQESVGSKRLNAFAGAYAWNGKDTFFFSPTNTAWPELYKFNLHHGLQQLPVEPFYDVQALAYNDGMLTIGVYDEGRRAYKLECREDLSSNGAPSLHADPRIMKWLSNAVKPFLERCN